MPVKRILLITAAIAWIVLWSLFACSVRVYGQPLQGEFAPQPPPVVAIPQPPYYVQPAPVLVQPPPRLVPTVPQGVWVPVRRPTGIGNFLFGPVWTFIPTPPPQQRQQMPAPQPQYDSRQRGIQ